MFDICTLNLLFPSVCMKHAGRKCEHDNDTYSQAPNKLGSNNRPGPGKPVN